MTKKIGIVLCGGGVRGLCQIGVLHALEKNDIKPGYISGASIGAIIGLFYAAGISPLEILEISKKSTMIRIFNPTIGFKGLSNLNYLKNLIEKHIPYTTFDQLQKKLFVAATNLNRGTLDIFSEGDCIKPVLASASVPVIFEPQEINGQKYLDAGILNNVPVEPILGNADLIIGNYVHRHGPLEDASSLDNWKGVFDRAATLSFWEKDARSLEKCDFVIEPREVWKLNAFNKKDDEKLFNIGVEETEKMIPAIKEAIENS
jgi:NTE family protein